MQNSSDAVSVSPNESKKTHLAWTCSGALKEREQVHIAKGQRLAFFWASFSKSDGGVGPCLCVLAAAGLCQGS